MGTRKTTTTHPDGTQDVVEEEFDYGPGENDGVQWFYTLAHALLYLTASACLVKVFFL